MPVSEPITVTWLSSAEATSLLGHVITLGLLFLKAQQGHGLLVDQKSLYNLKEEWRMAGKAIHDCRLGPYEIWMFKCACLWAEWLVGLRWCTNSLGLVVWYLPTCCVCECVCACVCMCTPYMWRPEVSLRSHSSGSVHLFFLSFFLNMIAYRDPRLTYKASLAGQQEPLPHLPISTSSDLGLQI